MARRAALLLFALLLPAAACGDEETRGRALAETVAGGFRKDCESGPPPPDPAMRAHLERLCACTEAKIAATPMRFGESDRSVGAKIRAASKACLAEIGGAPGEGR